MPPATITCWRFPYTKLHNTSWNVDQASALLFCSVAKARELGIAENKWVYPRSRAESNYILSLAQKPALDRLPAARIAGEKALQLAHLGVGDLDFIELYSCFPIAVEMYAAALGLPEGKGLTITGGMPFAGGPLNNYVYQSTCRMVELLRRRPGSNGLVSTVSGLMTKQSFAVWSTRPGSEGFGFADVTEAVHAEFPACDVAENYCGEARIVGYTVLYQNQQPHRAVAVVALPDGGHTMAWSEDVELTQAMQQAEYCDVAVNVNDNIFTVEAKPQ